MTGVIKTLSHSWGFVKATDGVSYFFHRTALSDPELFEELAEGDALELLEVENGPKGWKATSVVPQAASAALAPPQDAQQEQQAQQPEENAQPAA